MRAVLTPVVFRQLAEGRPVAYVIVSGTFGEVDRVAKAGGATGDNTAEG